MVRVLLPTLVRRKAPLVMPARVMSPAVAIPLVALTRLEPTLALAASTTLANKVAAVLELLMRAPSELTEPKPVMLPEPP